MLVELLVVIATIAVLAAMLLPALPRGKELARARQCLDQMRQIGLAVRLYADDNQDTFPRSEHSAFANGVLPWECSVAPMLGSDTAVWTNLLAGVYHCPSDKRATTLSYGLSVYFELGLADNYIGKPQTWRLATEVPRPAATILFAENASAADHLMPNFWITQADAVDLASNRHNQRGNYAFVDGHAILLPLGAVFAPPQVDLFNPSLAQ